MSHQTSDQNLEDSSTPPRGGPDHRPRHDEGVGDRLGQARDQRPDLTTAASPAPSSVAEGGVALNRVFQTPGPYRQGPNLQPQAQGDSSRSTYKPIYGSTKGSYVSPYDSGGKTPGNTRNFHWTTPDKVYDRSIGPITRKVASGQESGEKTTPAPAKRTIQVPFGAKDRVLILGPYKLMRSQCSSQAEDFPVMGELKDWLDLHMHEDLHKSNEIDAIIPTCVITVVLPMTDEHWANYHQALKFFPKALELYTMLSVGKDNFDQVTAGHKDAEGNLTYPQLSLEGQTLEEMLGGMVKGRRLGIPWDWERMGNRPAMLPTEYGGQLKDYVS